MQLSKTNYIYMLVENISGQSINQIASTEKDMLPLASLAVTLI